MDLKINTDLSKLKQLQDIFKENYIIEAGILGGNYTENNKSITVASIGKVQEFGSVVNNIPSRSFIRTPLNNHLSDDIDKIKNKLIQFCIDTKSMYKTYFSIATIMRNIIIESFSNQGDGTWAPNSPITIRKKGSSSPLIDTGRLRKSIDFNIINLNK